MGTSRNAAQVTQRIARFVIYDPDETGTGIGNPSAAQIVQGYDNPNLQAGLDELYVISTVQVGGIYTSQYQNNPNPTVWNPDSGEDIYVDGQAVVVTTGEDGIDVATNTAATITGPYVINYVGGNTFLDVTFNTPADEPLIEVVDAYGVVSSVVATTPGQAEVTRREILEVTVEPTADGNITFGFPDNGGDIVVAILDADTDADVATKIASAIDGDPRFSAIAITNTVVVTFDLGQVTTQEPSGVITFTDTGTTGATVTATLDQAGFDPVQEVQRIDFAGTAVGGSLPSAAINQKDNVVVGFSHGADEIIDVVIDGIIIPISVTAATTPADIITEIQNTFSPALDDFYLIDNTLPTSFDITYVGDFLQHFTDGFQDFGAASTITLTYSSITDADPAGELGYGKWVYFGEDTIDTPAGALPVYTPATGTTPIYYWERIE